MLESQKEADRTLARVDSDRELQVVLEMSRVEAAENDRRRLENQLYRDLSESYAGVEEEKTAPEAPPEFDELSGTMEVAMKLSKQEHEHEMAMRSHKAPSFIQAIGQDSAPSTRGASSRNQDAFMEYSQSTEQSGIARAQQPMALENASPRIVATAELVDDAIMMRSSPSVVDESEGDEAIALAMALSKMNSEARVDPGPPLSQEESLAYALELSRREPGAHGSSIERPMTNRVDGRRGRPSSPTNVDRTNPVTLSRHSHSLNSANLQHPYQVYYPHPYAYPYPPPYQYPYPQPFQQPYPHVYPSYPAPPVYHQVYPPPFPQPYLATYPLPPFQPPYPPPHLHQQPYPIQPPSFDGSESAGGGLPSSISAHSSRDEEEAVRMAMELSRTKNNGRTDRSVATTASWEDDESLAIALERSRVDH